jgi:hypothetical protein
MGSDTDSWGSTTYLIPAEIIEHMITYAANHLYSNYSHDNTFYWQGQLDAWQSIKQHSV